MNRVCPYCKKTTDAAKCPADGFRTVKREHTTASASSDPLIGTTFEGRYRIEGVLGQGGMGTVYRATQLSVDRAVALKVVTGQRTRKTRDIARFKREAKAIAALHHPNIVGLIDFGQDASGALFLVMELIEGVSLTELLKAEAPLSPERVIGLSQQILQALDHAHSRGIIHRDLKPDNIYVTALDRRQEFVKVLDFGIAKLEGEEETDAVITSNGIIVGSPRYMAPEQAKCEDVTRQTDLYSLGTLMYEMLTGRPVFDAPSAAACVVLHLTTVPDPPSRDGKLLEGPLVDCINDLLEKELHRRPEHAEAVLQRFEKMPSVPAFVSAKEVRKTIVRKTNDARAASPSATMTVTGGGLPTERAPSPKDFDTAREVTASDFLEKDPSHVETRFLEKSQVNTSPRRKPRVWALVAALLVVCGVGALIVGQYGNEGAKEGARDSTAVSQDGGQALEKRVEVNGPVADRLGTDSPVQEPTPIRPTRTVPPEGTKAAKKAAASGVISPSKSQKRAAKKSLLVVDSFPSAAEVHRGGKRVGSTPFEVPSAWRGGEITLSLSKTGYKKHRLKIAPDDERQSVQVSLKKRRKPTKRSSRKPRSRYKKVD